MDTSPTFALRPVPASPSLSPTMHPSQDSSIYEGSVTNGASSSGGEHNGRASIFAGEEEPRGTKVSERPGWVTVIVNRKRGQLEVPTEEYEEWLDAVTKDDAPRRKKILNKWGGRRRTMDRRESGFKPPAAAEAENSGASSTSSPPTAAASLPPLTQTRRHSTSTPYLPPISSVGPLPPLRSSPPSPPYYQSSFKRPRHHYDYPPSNDYSDSNGVKRQRSSLQLPPLSFDSDRSRHDRMYWEPPVSSAPYNRLTWEELKTRYDHQVSMLERDGLELEIASAQSRKCEIDFLNDEAVLGDAEVMYSTMTRRLEKAESSGDSYDAARAQEEVDRWYHEVEKRRRNRDISHDSMMRTRAEIDISARACTLGRMEIEKTRDAMMDILIRLRPHPPRP